MATHCLQMSCAEPHIGFNLRWSSLLIALGSSAIGTFFHSKRQRLLRPILLPGIYDSLLCRLSLVDHCLLLYVSVLYPARSLSCNSSSVHSAACPTSASNERPWRQRRHAAPTDELLRTCAGAETMTQEIREAVWDFQQLFRNLEPPKATVWGGSVWRASVWQMSDFLFASAGLTRPERVMWP
jgi:hypothetical protein